MAVEMMTELVSQRYDILMPVPSDCPHALLRVTLRISRSHRFIFYTSLNDHATDSQFPSPGFERPLNIVHRQ